MTNSLGAVALFIGIVSVIGVFFGKMGNLSFWKLAAQLPDQAFEWWTSDPTWVVLENSAPAYVAPGSTVASVPLHDARVWARWA